jgi:hypothetical protein
VPTGLQPAVLCLSTDDRICGSRRAKRVIAIAWRHSSVIVKSLVGFLAASRLVVRDQQRDARVPRNPRLRTRRR